MTELPYRLSAEKFLSSSDTGSRLIAVVWLILYVALVTMALSAAELSSMTEITGTLTR
jgi:hypothetical protein